LDRSGGVATFQIVPATEKVPHIRVQPDTKYDDANADNQHTQAPPLNLREWTGKQTPQQLGHTQEGSEG